MLDTYTFENYTVNKNNEFAYSAAKAVVKLLGSAYNPLFIYGESGNGKTHLLYSIKNELSKNGKDIKVCYTTSERVIDEFSSCKQNVDVLLIDNFQLFNGKYEIQDELINIFNHLLENNKQIVISSDKELSKFDILEELKNQINIGLFADIQNEMERKC